MTVPEPIHPGEHLAEIMQELGITPYRLAKTIGVPQIQIHNIVRCRRSITADTALRRSTHSTGASGCRTSRECRSP